MAMILIVDDLSANRTFLVTPLHHQGHRLIEAADGSQGLAAARAEHPDLVITACAMRWIGDALPPRCRNCSAELSSKRETLGPPTSTSGTV